MTYPTDRSFPLTRRDLMSGLGGAVLAPWLTGPAGAQGPQTLTLKAMPGTMALRSGASGTALWTLQPATPDAPLRFKRGGDLEITVQNELSVQVALNWQNLDGVANAEALLGRPPVAPGSKDSWTIPLRHAGTIMLDARLLCDAQAHPPSACALVVMEPEAAPVDRDEVLLIEDFRLRADGSAIAPGADARETSVVFTVNGKPGLDIGARLNERLRLRLINAAQRNAIALKIEDHDVRVMAIDGQPAEPFLARGGQLVMAPGSRVDVDIDTIRPPGSTSTISLNDGSGWRSIARLSTMKDAPFRDKPLSAALPLPSNGLPAQLDLKNAARFDIPLGATTPDWIKPAAIGSTTPPAFRVKAGRTVVLALTNRGAIPATFHLHGHHVRLLDRLDDGWKPFWLDTLLLDAGQTQRVAFAAEFAGRWLMEAIPMDWGTPRLVRWYAVD